jgi:thiol-disulfide isomerase/thioredoxin
MGMGSRIILSLFIPVVLWISSAPAATINDHAPLFKLNTLDGKPASLGDFRGKVVYINFWASWCGPCEKEFPELINLAEKYKEEKFVLLAITLDLQKSDAQGFLENQSPRSSNVVILWDPEMALMPSYGFRSLPMSYILDKEGVIRHIHFGYRESDPLKWPGEIDSLLK